MSEKILACPFCGSDNTRIESTWGKYFGTCGVCGANGPESNRYPDAILLWNAAANALAAKDAEIEQLRKERHTMCVDYERVEAERDEARRVARHWYKTAQEFDDDEYVDNTSFLENHHQGL